MDFGQGFYLTEDYTKAKKWALHKASVRAKKPAVVSVEFDIESARDIIETFTDDLRWGRFVINNRNGIGYIDKVSYKENNLDAKYHITYGRIADLNVLDVADRLKQTSQNLKSIDEILNRNFPMQYAFHTDEAIRYLSNFSYEVVRR